MMSDSIRDRCRHGSFTMMCMRYARGARYFGVCILMLAVLTLIRVMLSLLRPMGRLLEYLMRQAEDLSTEDPWETLSPEDRAF
jgi:hypothetical protein